VTGLLFRDDAYLTSCQARLVDVRADNGLVFDRTVFYAKSGGQPGDSGIIRRANGRELTISTTVTGETKDHVVHMPEVEAEIPEVGENVTLAINWQRRFNLMRMHTACHILSVVCPFPITGASVGEEESRVDLDLPDPAYTREFVTAEMQKIVTAAHPIAVQWINESELDANPGIVKSKNVRPPRGLGRIRLVLIGENGSVDSQPCGGTHVANTTEIGLIHISKIEKKGRENRRFRIRFGALPTPV
jgi:misacylated tRNA(Ala) deacylase